MQDAISRGSKQQRKPMASVAAYYDHVSVLAFGDALNLALWPPEDEILSVIGNLQPVGELCQMGFGLLVYLLLDGGKVHGDIPAVGEAQGFDDVYHVELRIESLRQRQRALRDMGRLFREIHRQHDALIACHVASQQGLRRPYTQSHYPSTGASGMTWLIIVVILIVAFGPVMWLMPSQRDRYLSKLRQQAHLEGLVVELRRLPKVNPTPEERVSAGGVVREPVVECMAYTRMLPRRMHALGDWRLLRDENSREVMAVPAGWSIDRGFTNSTAGVGEVTELLPGLLDELPTDVIGIEVTSSAVSLYWLERAGSEVAVVTRLGGMMEGFGTRQQA